MTIVVICLLIVVLMPFIAKVPLALMMHKTGRYDNRHPRDQQASLTGFGARALAAHQNCFEATTYFAPSVLLVLAVNAMTQMTAYLSIAFVVCRLAYLVCYWADYHIARSSFWIVGVATVVAHYVFLLSAFT